MILAKTTVANKVRLTTSATGMDDFSMKLIRMKLTAANARPTNALTRSSRLNTLSQSPWLISPSAKPRIINVED